MTWASGLPDDSDDGLKEQVILAGKLGQENATETGNVPPWGERSSGYVADWPAFMVCGSGLALSAKSKVAWKFAGTV